MTLRVRMTAGLLSLAILAAGFLVPLRCPQKNAPEQEADDSAGFVFSPENLVAARRTKEAATRELVAGRLSLVEAAERFRPANPEMATTILNYLRTVHPGAPAAELLCRHVIDWVMWELQGQPERCLSVVARLQMELRGLRAPQPAP